LGWLKLRVSLEEFINRKDIFLALNQAIPIFTKARIIAFSHGLAPLYFPGFYPDKREVLKKQTKEMLKRADLIVVSSEKVKSGFNDIYKPSREVVNKIKVLPFGIPQPFIQKSNKYKKKKICLYVGMGHPVKNIQFIIDAFKQFSTGSKNIHYKLVLAGVNLNYFKTLNTTSIKNKVIVIERVTGVDLLKLYNEAEILLSASFYESFNFPIIEALSQQTQVVALKSATIPEYKQFVNISNSSIESFAQSISNTVSNPKTIDLVKLYKIFSWQNFTKKLIGFYEQI
jgi:glycosyltransferase involved in cell wall biosynthesis